MTAMGSRSRRAPRARSEERGVALIAADGLWSSLRGRLGDRTAPRFARHTAWRALAPADAVTADQRAPAIDLWLGQNAHLVHYPVRSGALINIVAIIRDDWREPGWSAPGNRADILARYPGGAWSPAARAVLAAPQHWCKWALYDRAPLARWGQGRGDIAGGCGPSNAAISRPGRRHGDRGRRGAGATIGGDAGRSGRGHAPLRAAAAAAAPPAPNAPHAAMARSITWAGRRRFCARSRSRPWAESGSSPATIGSMAGKQPDA